MAETNKYVAHLTQLREQIVKRRREYAEGMSGKAGESVKELQSQIEAVDRAIEDEVRIGPSVYEQHGLRTV